MEHLDGMLKLADKELEVFEKAGKFRSREEIDTAYKLIDIVKDIYCIWKYEEDSEYSEESYENRGGRSSRGRSYNGSYDGSYEGSYARGRGSSARRDSMGRYSREDGKEEYIRQLRSMAEDAPDERTRENISRMAREMERT